VGISLQDSRVGRDLFDSARHVDCGFTRRYAHMRITLAVVMATLALGLGHSSTFAQALAGSVPALASIDMVDALTGWAVTQESGAERLLHTSDRGRHWLDVSPAKPSDEQAASYRVSVLGSHVAWAALSDTAGWALTGTTHVFHTVDGGRTWSNVAVAALDAMSIHFINPHEGWLLSEEWDGSGMGRAAANVYRSIDDGAIWSNVAATSAHNQRSGLPLAGHKMAITFRDAATGWITGGGNVSDQLLVYVTRNSGRTWRRQQLPLPRQVTSPWQGHPTPPKFFTVRDGVLAVEYDYGETQQPPSTAQIVVFYVSHDGGMTWADTTPVHARLASWRTPPTFVDMSHGWATDGLVLHATSDGGQLWTTIPTAPPFAAVEQLDFISPQIGWALRSSESSGGTPKSPSLLETLDGGRTWASIAYTISRP
jgi:photosystem II stability/assembly factor-like uncharacterized protein